MRHTIVTCGVLVLSISIHASAGTVHFNPPSATITPGTQSVSFDVSVSWETLPTIDTVSAAFLIPSGVNSTMVPATGLSDWPCGIEGCSPFPPASLPPGYAESVGVGGNIFTLEGWKSPLLIATLNLDVSRLLAGESVAIIVDSDFEANLLGSALSLVAKGVNQEPLTGTVTITVVPEPSTVAFILLTLYVGLARKGWVSL